MKVEILVSEEKLILLPVVKFYDQIMFYLDVLIKNGLLYFHLQKMSAVSKPLERFHLALCSELTKCRKNQSVISVKIQKNQILNIMIKLIFFFFT